MTLLIAHQRGLIPHPHHPAVPGDNAVLHPEGFAGLVRPGFLGQHPLPVFGVQRPEPVLFVDLLRFPGIPEHRLVLGAHVSYGFWIAGLDGLLYVGYGRNLFHERPVAGLGLPEPLLRLLALGYVANKTGEEALAVSDELAERDLQGDLLTALVQPRE